MTLAWKSGAPAGQKMVLLALSDNANDQGECYPSISMLARKCSMSVRTVQSHISDMEELGIVRRQLRVGRSTIYHIYPGNFCTPADIAPRQNPHPGPAGIAPPPPQNLHPAPAMAAPITANQPSIESSKNQRKCGQAVADDFVPLDALLAEGVDAQVAKDWLTIRKVKKAQLTRTALDQTKQQAALAGLPLNEALLLCCQKDWRGFEAAWVAPRAGGPGATKGGQSAYEQGMANAERAKQMLFGKP